jgi:hypothetical protein
MTSLVDIENELKSITAELDFDTPAPDRRRAALEQDILSSSLGGSAQFGGGASEGQRALSLALRSLDPASPVRGGVRVSGASDDGGSSVALIPHVTDRRVEVATAAFSFFLWKLVQHHLSVFVLAGEAALAVPAPLFACWIQSVVCVGISLVLGLLGARATDDGALARFPPLRISLRTIRLTARVSLAFVAMISLDTVAHRSDPGAVRHAGFALAPLGAIAVGALALKQATLPRDAALRAAALGAIALMLLGSMAQVTHAQTQVLRWTDGVVFAWTAAAVWTAYAVQIVANESGGGGGGVTISKWALVAANAVNSVVLLAPLVVLSGELDTLWAHSDIFRYPAYWGLALFAGLTRYCLAGALVEQIFVTSPLSHLVANVAGAASIVVLDAMLSQSANLGTVLSACVVLAGGGVYCWARRDE